MADGRNCGIPGEERPCITLSLCSGDEVTQAERLEGRTRLSDSGDGHMIAGADGLSIKDPRRRSWTHPGPWGVSLHGRPYAVSGLGHRRPDPEAALWRPAGRTIRSFTGGTTRLGWVCRGAERAPEQTAEPTGSLIDHRRGRGIPETGVETCQKVTTNIGHSGMSRRGAPVDTASQRSRRKSAQTPRSASNGLCAPHQQASPRL